MHKSHNTYSATLKNKNFSVKETQKITPRDKDKFGSSVAKISLGLYKQFWQVNTSEA